MPVILELFLSKYIFLVLGWIYFIGMAIVVIGFKMLNITRRKDVKVRGSLMLGTFIFLSHSIGLMSLSIVYLFLIINSVVISQWVIVILVIVGTLVADIIYIFISNYLWDRLAIEHSESMKLSLYSLIIVTPWYFIMNFFS